MSEIRFIKGLPVVVIPGDPDMDEKDIFLPSKAVVCWRCRGTGSHVNPSIDGHGITPDEMNELGPEFFDDYMGGMYDVTCGLCKGKRITAEVIECELSAEQNKAYEEDWQRDEAERSEQRLRDMGVQF
mgnify:CR=1 FL=1|jgi:hypothetical protein